MPDGRNSKSFQNELRVHGPGRHQEPRYETRLILGSLSSFSLGINYLPDTSASPSANNTIKIAPPKRHCIVLQENRLK